MSHTKGPWFTKTERFVDGLVITSESRESERKLQICDVKYAYPLEPAENLCPFEIEQTANVRLIAAAPDLLEVLMEIVPQLRGLAAFGSNCAQGLVDKADAVIAKVKGEQP